jgi:putative ABC transport system permease protein
VTQTTTPSSKAVGRQVMLPLRRAVEIAWKNIRMRLSRSLLVTSGIVLALAFLMAILTTEAMTDSMRGWARSAEKSDAFASLHAQRDKMLGELKTVEGEIRSAAHQAAKAAGAPFDMKSHFGRNLPSIKKEFGVLPVADNDLLNVLASDPSAVSKFQQWIRLSTDLAKVKEQLTGPQRLEAIMKAQGVPTSVQDVADARLQTRWLLGLALLVAFVGILNAMLMSVTERYREIGTMKCLGALDGFIVKLFVIESLFQGIVGTIIGVLLGLGLSLLSVAASYGHYAWQDIPAGRLLLSTALCFAIGIGLTVAGAVYPAWQAARMHPIEAMRVET